MLVCQTFTMSDLVMLLHGQHQPLSRIQPQLLQFFTQNYLNGREPTDENISVSTHPLTHREMELRLVDSASHSRSFPFSCTRLLPGRRDQSGQRAGGVHHRELCEFPG